MNLPESLRSGPVYLDYNATTPVDPQVAATMRPYLAAHFGNPSSDHAYAFDPHQALTDARAQLAELPQRHRRRPPAASPQRRLRTPRGPRRRERLSRRPDDSLDQLPAHRRRSQL